MVATPRILLVATGIAVAGSYVVLRGIAPRQEAALHAATVEQFCIDCHNDAELTGGISFEGVDVSRIGREDTELWEKAIIKLSADLMPPSGEPRPGRDDLVSLRLWLADGIDVLAAAAPRPGAPALHRLNRYEYGNAIRDLLDLDIDVTTMLPADDSRDGFDNIADALSISPAHMQAYLSAAQAISRLAVGDMTASPGITTYRAPRGLSQAEHFDGMGLGTRGGLGATHVFPLDAEYEFTVRQAGAGFQLRAVGGDDAIEVLLDGERVRLLEGPDGRRPFRLAVEAGPHVVEAAIVQSSRPRGVDDLYAVLAASTSVQSISIMGPFTATGPGDTPSRRRIFVCRPDGTLAPDACARQIVTALAARAFRRPPAELDSSIETLLDFYAQGFALGGFETGVKHALARLLVDPQFIFRFEREPDGIAPGTVYPIDDYELATRLAFFLWSSLPDDELLAAAADQMLSDDAELQRQVLRMLAEPKAEALVENFARQWLGLTGLESVNPQTSDFDGNLRAAFARETEMLIESVLEENASVVDLLRADYTFVDERLARHYGFTNIRGSRFRRVDLAGTGRRGLLGHGSILTVTSPPTRTSPVARGAWVLENLLGTPAPTPPEGVDTDLDRTAAPVAGSETLRARLERHRSDPACAACHNIIDPMGFALENFDLTGRWRDTDAGASIDARGQLWDGTELDGPAGLTAALLDRQELFVRAFTEKLLTYALGRALSHHDMPAVRAILAGARGDEHRFASLVLGIVRSVPFRYRQAEI